MVLRPAEFQERFRPFERRYGLHPESYQIRHDDGTPGGWIPRVEVWEGRRDESIVQVLYEKSPTPRTSREAADATALWMGLEWLEKNRSSTGTDET